MPKYGCLHWNNNNTHTVYIILLHFCAGCSIHWSIIHALLNKLVIRKLPIAIATIIMTIHQPCTLALYYTNNIIILLVATLTRNAGWHLYIHVAVVGNTVQKKYLYRYSSLTIIRALRVPHLLPAVATTQCHASPVMQYIRCYRK